MSKYKHFDEFQKAVVLQASARGALHEKLFAKGQDVTRKERPFTVDRKEYNLWIKQKGFM